MLTSAKNFHSNKTVFIGQKNLPNFIDQIQQIFSFSFCGLGCWRKATKLHTTKAKSTKHFLRTLLHHLKLRWKMPWISCCKFIYTAKKREKTLSYNKKRGKGKSSSDNAKKPHLLHVQSVSYNLHYNDMIFSFKQFAINY